MWNQVSVESCTWSCWGITWCYGYRNTIMVAWLFNKMAHGHTDMCLSWQNFLEKKRIGHIRLIPRNSIPRIWNLKILLLRYSSKIRFVSLMPRTLPELRQHISEPENKVNRDMLRQTWEQLDYHWDLQGSKAAYTKHPQMKLSVLPSCHYSFLYFHNIL